MTAAWTGFRSPLATHIVLFLATKRALGCRFEIVDVPQFRLDDAPRTEERVLRSSTCRHRVHARSPIDYAEPSPGTKGIRPS